MINHGEFMVREPALLALADGTLFWGESIGATGQKVGEVVFNTAMTGYQEILTDPSYCQQLIALTYPHIGNVGTNLNDQESSKIVASGLIIRDLPLQMSNYRATETLDRYLKRNGVVAISRIDVRRLTRLLREKGSQNGCLVAGNSIDPALAVQQAQSFPGLTGMDLAKEVTTPVAYQWNKGLWSLEGERLGHPYPTEEGRYHVVAYDFGVKQNILRMLANRGCRLTVVPATTSADEVLSSYQPDGIFLSNGPGDPEPCEYAIRAIKTFLDKKIPMFGICLGHQLLALASGARTTKMKFGHHGANHPVLDVESRRVWITSQNHGFAVQEENMPNHLRITHYSLFDRSIQGIEVTHAPAFSFQGHPEASPGPHESSLLFDRFITLMERGKTAVSPMDARAKA